VDKAIFLAPDISCHHCAMAIKKALSKVEGVGTVDVDVPSKKVTVDYDTTKTTLPKIESAMSEEGYPVAK
jgi:copper chaperone CopZ